MRNAAVQLILVIIGVSSIHAARMLATSSFHVRINPIGPGTTVVAIQGHDTLLMSKVKGVFYLRSINPGRWRILVGADSPYRDARYDLTVKPGYDADLGELLLVRE